MTISAVSSLNSVASASSTSSSTSGTSSTSSISSALNVNFTTYLQLLTTQLKNQDPTNASDPNQFTQELIQIEQVMVQNNTNTDIENMTKASTTNSLATGIGYIGNYVQADSSSGQFSLQNSSAEIGYTLANTASNATITIKNSSGVTVATLSGGTSSGGNYVTWNGTDASGNALSDGAYTFTVSATDASGNSVTSSNPVALFKVTSVQTNTDGTLQLLAGSLSLATSDVTNVYGASSLPSATAGTVTG